MIKAVAESLISVIFPVPCELCGAALPLQGVDGVCQDCERSLRPIPGPYCARCGRSSPCLDCAGEHFHFDRVLAACLYEDSAKKLLRTFKFRRQKTLLPLLLRLLEKRLRGDPAGWNAVAAVPMRLWERLERGFNQAALLASGVSRLTGAPLLKDVLLLRGGGKQQAKLGKKEREANVAHRFRAGTAASGKRILLVDDILTTGATASECARALKEAGASSVDVLVVARGR